MAGGTTQADIVSRNYYKAAAETMGDTGLIMAFNHSQGSIINSNTAKHQPEFFRQHVIGNFFGAPQIGDSQNYKKIYAYVAPCDGVCLFGMAGYVREYLRDSKNIKFCRNQGNALKQHFISEPCYAEGLADAIETYNSKFRYTR